jgi:integrase
MEGKKMKQLSAIKSKNTISAIRVLLAAGPNGPRNEAIFILGINSAYRTGDLLNLTIGDLVENGKIKNRLALKEQKTQKSRQIALNDVTLKVLANYLKSRGAIKELDPKDPFFPSSQTNTPMTRQQFHKILKEVGKKLGLENFGPHSLRKTFGYHIFKASGNNISLVQKLLNHSSQKVTLRYIGIEQEDLDDACLTLNLY